jgi:hypothetical protein
MLENGTCGNDRLKFHCILVNAIYALNEAVCDRRMSGVFVASNQWKRIKSILLDGNLHFVLILLRGP